MNKRLITLCFFILVAPLALYYALEHPSTHPSPSPETAIQPVEPKTLSVPVSTTPAESVDTRSQTKPSIHTWQSSQGTAVYFWQNPTLPMLDIHISFDAGSSRDGQDFGLAYLWLQLLDQGNQSLGLNADQIAAGFENQGAVFNTRLERDRAIIALRTLSDPKILQPVIHLFTQMIAQPSFSASSIDLIKSQMLNTQKMSAQQPEVLARNAFYQAIYGNHAYAHVPIGSAQSLQAITQKNLQDFHQQYAVAPNAVLTIVGDLDLEQAKTMSEQILRALPAGHKASPVATPEPLKTEIKQHIVYPSEQTHLLMGAPCMAVNNPNYFALLIANEILGANPLVSRLFQEIRNKRGLAYHVSSKLFPLKETGPFRIQLQTQNHQIKEAIALVTETLRRFIQEGPSESELSDAKESVIQAFPLSMNTNEKIIAELDEMAFYQKPTDFLDHYQEHIKKVSLSEVQEALKRYLHPEHMAIITVGPIAP